MTGIVEVFQLEWRQPLTTPTVLMKTSFVYILTNKNKTTLYIGVTNNLQRRITEHQDGIGSKFSRKYKTNHLIYYERFSNILEAIAREKQLKRWSRSKKEILIQRLNPEWEFLNDSFAP